MTKYSTTMGELLTQIREGFSSKEIKMAIGIASDKRYAGGNMTGAVNAIEKIKKGLSDHPQVRAVLKRQNEEVELDEDGHTDVASAMNNVKVAMSALTKMSGELAKLNPEDALPSWWTNKVAVAVDKLDGMADYLDTQVEEVSESARSDAMRAIKKDKDMKQNPFSKDDDASADDVKAASKNIIMQLRKSVSLKGNHSVEFASGKQKVDARIAQAVQDKFNKIQRPADKQKFQDKIAKSYKDLLMALKEQFDEEVELDEGRMKELHGYMEKGISAQEIAKKMKLDVKTIQALIGEEVELDEGMKMNDPKLLKMFDKLKKGDKIKLKTSSTISQGKDYVEYIVKSKNLVNKGRVEKITLATVGNEGAVKKFLYKRDGTVGFAIGDMGASVDDIKEGTWALPDSPKAKAELKKLMSKPIKLGKEGDDAADKLYAIIGDDELFDDLYVAGKKNPNGDARDVVKKHMKRLGIKEEIELDEKTAKTFGVEFQINAPDEKPIRTGNEPHVKLVNKLVKKYKLFDNHADDLSKFNVKDDVGGRDVQRFFNDLSKAGYDVVKKKITDNYTSRTLGKEGFELDEKAPKMTYALVGTDMKIYSMGSDERDLRLDRKSLEKRFKDVAPLKMARLKTAQSIGDKVDKSQLKEEVELDEIKEPFVVVDTADGNKIVGMASDEKNAKSIITTSQLPPMKIKDKKTLKIVKVKKKQMIGQPIKEEEEPNKPDSAKEVDKMRDDKKKTRIAQLQLQIAKASETINKLNAQEK